MNFKNIKSAKVKKLLFGTVSDSGLIKKVLLYTILCGVGFIFLYPILQMFVISLMSLQDIIDPTVMWIPTGVSLANYGKAFTSLNYFSSFFDSIIISLFPALATVVSSSLIGYGFAHYNFPGKKIWFAVVVAVFLIPTMLLSLPTLITFNELGLLKSIRAYIYPALTGFGIRQSVFILIFYQFFKMLPKELSEAAEVDGCNEFTTFIKIAAPMSVQAFIICFLYSFVWYWNETDLAMLYFQDTSPTAASPYVYSSLQMNLYNFKNLFESMFAGGNVGAGSLAESFNEGVLFAGTMLTILPLLILYAFTQKYFVESADNAGIAGG